MDFDIPWELIVLILFFVLPALSRLFQKKEEEDVFIPPPDYETAAPDYPREERPQRAAGTEPDSLEDALRQIREALGQPGPVAERRPEAPQRAPRPEPPRPRPEPPRPRPEPIQARQEARRPPPVRPAPPTPAPPHRSRTADTRFSKGLDTPIDLDKPLVVESTVAVPPRLAWLYETLRDPVEARKAIKMHEILEPPESVKRLRPR